MSDLHVADENNSKSLVLACGAHLEVIDGCGLTPLHIASIVEAIVKRVGRVEVLDLRGVKGLTGCWLERCVWLVGVWLVWENIYTYM